MKRTLVVSVGVLALAAVSFAGVSRGGFRERLNAALGKGVAAASEVRAQAASEVFSSVSVLNSAGVEVATMQPDELGEGIVGVGNISGAAAAGMLVDADGAGAVVVFNTAGEPSFVLQGNAGLISVAADMAEVFPAPDGIEPGSVLAIDPLRKGAMTLAQRPYDRRVAGVASGARDFRPGITLGAKADGSGVKMTLTGTVYCRVTNANGAIRAGDLLTTSAVPGHAMRVTDYEAAHGATLGKALEDFDGRSGTVLILASLN